MHALPQQPQKITSRWFVWVATAFAAVAVSAACIAAMAYEAYWAPRLCQVGEIDRHAARERIGKIGSVSIAVPPADEQASAAANPYTRT